MLGFVNLISDGQYIRVDLRSETVEKHVNLLCLCLHVDHDIFVRCIGGIFVLELMPIAGLA
jgi:hypothetical protein